MDTPSDAYLAAAKAISEASFIMIGAGAGMSADSGLKTYGEVSDLDWFAKNNLTYRDLANPDLLVKNPDWFYAWAGSCVDMFKAQDPHEGYDVLLQMRASMVDSKWKDVLTKEITENPFKPTNHKDIAGPFFVLTTNVDTFFTRAGFKKEEICQTHGNYFEWQCGGLMREKHPFKFFNGPCHKATWPIPKDFQFDYNTNDMSCPEGPPKNAVGDWNSNRPKCPKCGLYARPNVYQFGDQCFITNEYEENNSANWLHAVEQIVKRDPTAKVVFIELGVGQRLPKLRVIFERSQKELPQGQCTIIRVNPEVKTESVTAQVIGLPVGGKEALAKIWGLVEKQ